MDGAKLLRVQRGIYYAALNLLAQEEVPHDLWPLVMDGAAGHVKDDALTVMVSQSAGHDKSEEADDGVH